MSNTEVIKVVMLMVLALSIAIPLDIDLQKYYMIKYQTGTTVIPMTIALITWISTGLVAWLMLGVTNALGISIADSVMIAGIMLIVDPYNW